IDMVVQVILWAIVGAIAGYLANQLVRGRKRRLGEVSSVLLGMAGAFVGAGLMNLLNIDLGLESISISLEDLVAAFLGSLLLLAVIGLLRR
ncbi:MAG: GlsB/YeaQ/YmgE family stress response membrane protein, partial [Anaerolineae bacterium]|nr:GlsB/YeaQ/YmgE family stress response membrane protein [Anaerolineae bacterium]